MDLCLSAACPPNPSLAAPFRLVCFQRRRIHLRLFCLSSPTMRFPSTRGFVRRQNRNLRNPPPPSLRRDRFCVICGCKLAFICAHLRLKGFSSRLFASIRGWFGFAGRHDDFNVGLVQRLAKIQGWLVVGLLRCRRRSRGRPGRKR